jgi:flagellin
VAKVSFADPSIGAKRHSANMPPTAGNAGLFRETRKDAHSVPLMEERTMGLIVNTNVAALNTARVLRRSTLNLNKSLQRLSSGLRINSAADDAAGLAIAEAFRSRVRGLAVAQRNAQDGISFVQTVEGALSETTNILQRIRELSIQAANGINSAANRTALQNEVTQLIAQIDAIATNTEFNGVNPLSAATTITLQIGADNGQILAITSVGATSAILLPTTPDLATSVVTAGAAIALVDAALLLVNSQRAALGATQNRLEFTISTLAIEAENSAASESTIRDANIATETIAFTRNQILVSAGTSILAQANIVPQTALQLLQ